MNAARPVTFKNSQFLTNYIGVILIAVGAVAGLLWAVDREKFAVLTLLAPLALVIVSCPRVALWQFVFALFFVRLIVLSPPVFVVEVSAGLLILAAVFDTLLYPERDTGRSGFVVPFVAILGALAISSLFAYSPLLGVRPIARVALMFVTFLSLMRLLRYVRIGAALKVYFWIAVSHAALVTLQFVGLSGQGRLFGFAPAVFDELMMLALPIGVAFTLDGRRRRSVGYLLGTSLVFLGLLATQSRGPILLGAVSASLVVVLMWRRVGGDHASASPEKLSESARTRRRIRLALVGGAVAVSLLLIAMPSLFDATLGRFERLFTTDPSGTFRLRLELWQTAWRAFMDHPLLGVGPGAYRSLPDIYQSLHLDPTYFWVRGLTAHNLTLHYLAEAGLIGAAALYWLFGGQFVRVHRLWKRISTENQSATHVSVYALSVALLLTVILEAGWMWGQPSFIAAFFLALIATYSRDGQKEGAFELRRHTSEFTSNN